MDYGYITYIDEAGDPGLRKVRPLDEDGSSEWLILSALLLRRRWEGEVVGWVDEIRDGLGIRQRRDLHYRDLSPTRRVVASNCLAGLPVRAFVVCSNKKNMRGYHNPRAAKTPSQEWFYNWCLRLLLERVTAFCAGRSLHDYGCNQKLKIEFSRRGGHRYSQTRAYNLYLRHQQQAGSVFLRKRVPMMDFLDTDLMEDRPHKTRAGLQLADVVASAFYQAADCLGPGQWDLEPAKALRKIMAKESGVVRDFGVTLRPSPAWKAELTSDQQLIFEHYGYDFAKW